MIRGVGVHRFSIAFFEQGRGDLGLQQSTAQKYHEATKYDPASIHRLPPADASQQPVPFKTYHSDRAIDLIPYLPVELFPQVAEESGAAEELDSLIARLSRILYFTYGATGRKVWPGGHQIFRAAPSAGGLYPAEVYVASRGVEELPDGLHSYFVPNHQLIPVFDGELLSEIANAAFDGFDPRSTQLVLIVTGIYQRSTWRYHERSYRRLLLDSGHVLGNLMIYAPVEGLHPRPITCFEDDALNGLLFLDPDQEHVQIVAPLFESDRANPLPGWRVENGASSELSDDSSFVACHRASNLSSAAEIQPRRTVSSEISSGPSTSLPSASSWKAPEPLELGREILHRRSTRQFDRSRVERGALEALLGSSYRQFRSEALDPSRREAFQVPELVETRLLVRGVEGWSPGSHFLDLDRWALQQEREGDLSAEAHRFCLMQDLALDANLVVVHSADLSSAVATYGERVYRALHLDAGLLGEYLNLGALRAGLGVSGIGGFFDDQVNEELGLPTEHAILYVTVIGAMPSDSQDSDEDLEE